MTAGEMLSYQDINDLIKKNILIEDGNPARYRLQTKTGNLDQSEPYRKMTFGERDKNKPHKTILMVGETGTGKTKLINAMINYMLGVQREDKVWFEITDEQSDRTSAHSQTSRITVYGFYPQESPIHLTIIDTPGYRNTRGVEKDKEIAESLLNLSKSAEGVHEIDAVCLVIMAQQNRLSDRQQYVFDAVQSLFGRDIAENIVLLFTHSDGARPKNVLKAVKEAKIKCAVNDKKKPVFFLFDNCQGETFHEEFQMVQEHSWNLSFKGMTGFFKFLDNIKPKSLKMTQYVLQNRKHLEANISNLQSCVQKTELKQNEFKQTQEALKQNKKRTYENLLKDYDGKIGDDVSFVKKLEEELQELEKEKIKLVFEAFDCVETLEMITLNTESLITLLYIDFLIEKLKEINEPEKAEILENIKKRAGEEKHGALGFIKKIHKYF
ncbi:uncharacterized protein LOC127505982 isoform X2 [Ctenopharyngodon idella]|uniref:uncharacterized protein LOC127505982 isoform X2 n=1 Tax=Ctenopharyngodon idella TaxID=7959 RepID=UPI002230B2FF|nr:uncharacterized protein LOC127505982 isoform X2 [Ctenopharyngodon idella]XP_051737993.1 uncharacterized protein LOC127505982 isoform X2 [Ctenopharyngodon idella]